MPNWDQVSGILDRLLGMLAVWLVAKGYISASDAAQYIPLLIALAGALWAYYRNRPAGQLASAASVPGATVLAPPSLANAIPLANVISNTENRIVAK